MPLKAVKSKREAKCFVCGEAIHKGDIVVNQRMLRGLLETHPYTTVHLRCEPAG